MASTQIHDMGHVWMAGEQSFFRSNDVQPVRLLCQLISLEYRRIPVFEFEGLCDIQ